MAIVKKHGHSRSKVNGQQPQCTILDLIREQKIQRQRGLGQALERKGIRTKDQLNELFRLAAYGRTVEQVKKVCGVDLSQLDVLVSLMGDQTLGCLTGTRSNKRTG